MNKLKVAILISSILATAGTLISERETYAAQIHAINSLPASEAPAGLDDKTNGFVSQASFNESLGAFSKHYIDREGLGPVYNLETCLRCHQFPTFGGSGLILVTRAGTFDGKDFIAPEGGSMIHSVAVPPALR